MYGNGIQAGPGSNVTTIIQTVSPGMSIDIGKHWTLDYTPTLTFYSATNFQNSLNQSASLSGATAIDDWALGLSQTWSHSDTPLTETAAQTENDTFNTDLNANWAINSKMSATFDLNQNFNFVTDQQNSMTWSTMDWLDYRFWKRLTLGVGAGAGYVRITPNGNNSGAGLGDQTYQQLQLRIRWRITDKIALSANGGFDYRQYYIADTANTLDPIYGGAIDWAPFKYTQISFGVNSGISSSDYFVASQSTETTSLSLSLNQRLLTKYNLNVSGSYVLTDYNTVTGGFNTIRSDNNYAFNVRLSRNILKRGQISAVYLYNDNHSSEPGFGYHSNQVGFEFGFNY
jgi:hypothetical protein